MDFLREIRLLYEAFYHLKCDVTTKLDSLERCVRRQESLFDVIENIDRKLAYILPYTDAQNEVLTSPSLYRLDRISLPDEVYSAPPTVDPNDVLKNMEMFRSDTNLSYMKRKSGRCSGHAHRRHRNLTEEPTLRPGYLVSNINRSSSEEEECMPTKFKSDILVEPESKQDSGLESEHRSESCTSLRDSQHNDPLMMLLKQIEDRAVSSTKHQVVHQIAECDRYLNLVHERSKIAAQRDLLYEKLKSSHLERENCQLKVKDMRRNINVLETDKEWLVDKLEESIANKKQVMGKIGGMHSQFVKKSKGSTSPVKLEEAPKHFEPPKKETKRSLFPAKELKEELKLRDIVQETSVAELRRKLIKSTVKNYALQTKLDRDDSQLASRTRIKGGTFTKVKAASKYAPEISPVKTSKIPTMKPKTQDFEPSLILSSPSSSGTSPERDFSSLEKNSRTFMRSPKNDLSHISETSNNDQLTIIVATPTKAPPK